MATTPAKRACSVCGTLLADDSELCPVCALQQALRTQTYSDSNSSSELRFEHYTVLQNAEGKPYELGRGAMGVTYKAFDVHLQRPAALKIINAQLFGNESARARFVREARAAASVRHQNVASVFHIGESGGNYRGVLSLRLKFALVDRDWQQAKQLIEKMNGDAGVNLRSNPLTSRKHS